MGGNIRPELSKKNKYWIDKNRYYELKYYCLQYPLWKHAYDSLDGLRVTSYALAKGVQTMTLSDIVGNCVSERALYLERMNIVEQSAIDADPYLASYILKAVTEGLSFNYLKARLEIPCSRDMYYDRYRRFFWILNRRKRT